MSKIKTKQINWLELNPTNYPTQNIQIDGTGGVVGNSQFTTTRQTVTAVNGLNTINLNEGSVITLDLRSTTGDVNLTLNNPSESTYNVTVIDHPTTARTITINTTTISIGDATDFTLATSSITARDANTRYMLQLAYHSTDPIRLAHYVMTGFKVEDI